MLSYSVKLVTLPVGISNKSPPSVTSGTFTVFASDEAEVVASAIPSWPGKVTAGYVPKTLTLRDRPLSGVWSNNQELLQCSRPQLERAELRYR